MQLEYSGLVGWVASEKIIKLGKERMVDGGSLVMGVHHQNTLPTKTPLYDAIDGHVIGEVLGGFAYQAMETTRGWQRFDVKTNFGIASVWAK